MRIHSTWKKRRFLFTKIHILIIALLVIGSIFFVSFFVVKSNSNSVVANENVDTKVDELYQDILKVVAIQSGDTYGVLMENENIDISTANTIYSNALEFYDLVSVRAGKQLDFYYDGLTNELIRLEYKIDSEEELIVVKDLSQMGTGDWTANRQLIAYELREKVVGGEVKSSVYQAALDSGIDERAIIEMANAFQWSIDFAMDPRVGDTFKFAFQERYLDGEYVMPGKLLIGQYINAGTKHELFYFEESEENKGYFDRDGNSVQKMFLKAPVAFKYISSGFTTGSRYVAAFNVSTGHRAIDYATPSGTPIRSVGDGTVVFAGWSSAGYGYLTSIRHNGTYSTNYAHQSRVAVRYGQKVSQGEVIGYVGSTGFSTGPHLHYEMVKNGTKINPMYEVLPPGKPILDENKERFESEIQILIDKLTI
jgi:murein DD-endopeptidase MepM/ murein hydrolase activator NlpD